MAGQDEPGMSKPSTPSAAPTDTGPSTSSNAIPKPNLRLLRPDPHRTPTWSFIRDRSQADENLAGARGPESPIGSDASDRVFPISSVISVDPTPTPTPARYIGTEFPGLTAGDMSRSSSLRSEPSDPAGKGGPASGLSTETEMPTRPMGRASFELGPGSTASAQRLRTPRDRVRSVESSTKQIFSGPDSVTTKSSSMASTGGGVPLDEGFSRRSSSVKDSAARDVQLGEEIITTRFAHVVTADGHAVITGREGDAIQRCEDEPIHIPGAIQGFGVLIALREDIEGRYGVHIVSENSERIIGYSPAALFRLQSFSDILSEEQADNFSDHIDFIRDGEADPTANGPEVFLISIRSPGRKSVKLWCAMHVSGTNPDLIICEFELDDDPINPLSYASAATFEEPESTLNNAPTAEELEESTSNSSKPLRVLRSSRKQKGEAAAMEVFNIMSQVQEQLASAPNLEKFLKILVGVIKELTGFHRVMIYQFDQAWNGRVVTELVDPRATKDLYKGLNFPASDIPKQARDLYKINRVRLLYDRDQPTARLVCRTVEDLETPLDLTHSYLRAMSPIHIKYLANMSVRASMSISINAFDELWGLVACHTYGAKGMRVSFPVRKMCRLVGDSASRNIERLSYASRLQARKLINTVSTKQNPSGYIIASSEDLLRLFDADFGLLAIRQETKILGKLEQSQEALAMLEYLRVRRISSVITSQDVRDDFPDLRYPPGFQVVAGLLLVPLSSDGEDFIVFFRKSQLKEVKWAGNPYEKYIRDGTEGYLEPRKSFKTWTETVVGKCKEWTEVEIETAAVLCLVYGKFIAVWRQKEAALQNSRLTHLLLANSAHEVRTPLNAIINYLEIALEGNLDRETRDYLVKSHSASKSLICVINDLLDLTKTEEGQELIREEPFDLPATVKEAADMFLGDAKRKNIRLETVEAPGVPRMVLGDQGRVRQAVGNLTANAIQHTSEGSVKVEITVAGLYETRVEVDVIVEDTGVGMSGTQLDLLFREMEQVQSEEDLSLIPSEDDSVTERIMPANLTGNEKRTIGLGLAIVARIVRNMDGQLRLKSEEGKGSRFVIQLSFFLPSNQRHSATTNAATPVEAMAPSTPLPAEGEYMLINHASPKARSSRPNSIKRHTSGESVKSIRSMRSFSSTRSARSDAHKLLDAIQEPVLAGKRQALDQTASVTSKRSVTDFVPPQQPERRPFSEAVAEDGASLPLEWGRSPTRPPPGTTLVVDNATPIKAIKMHGGNDTPSGKGRSLLSSRGSVEMLGRPRPRPSSADETPAPTNRPNVLVAEDDPINSKIIRKRLEKLGYTVTLTVNGEDCASVFSESAANFDVILMDMQVVT